MIDERLKDEIRITVIATGFGEKEERKPALGGMSNANMARGRKVVHLGTIVDDLNVPTWERKKKESGEVETVTLDKASMQFSPDDEDRLDIPTFLRRQMD